MPEVRRRQWVYSCCEMEKGKMGQCASGWLLSRSKERFSSGVSNRSRMGKEGVFQMDKRGRKRRYALVSSSVEKLAEIGRMLARGHIKRP